MWNFLTSFFSSVHLSITEKKMSRYIPIFVRECRLWWNYTAVLHITRAKANTEDAVRNLELYTNVPSLDLAISWQDTEY